MSESTKSRARSKPAKPYPAFPLTPHPSGSWVKKVRGKLHYFGRWVRRVGGKLVRAQDDGWKEALALYESQAADLHAGRTPRPATAPGGPTVKDLVNHFLNAKVRKVAARELAPLTVHDYREVSDILIATLGAGRPVADLSADDFNRVRATMAERWGPHRLGNGISRTKAVFKYALDNGLVERPVRYGTEFRRPDRAVLRRHRASSAPRMIEAGQLRSAIAAADGPMRAMVLLGVNCGFGNTDCAALPLAAVNLDAGWIDFPRPKTGVGRRCALWPETVEAIRAAVRTRAKPATAADARLVFLTRAGTPWVARRDHSRCDMVSRRFRELMIRAGLHRPGLGFYSLRHVFRTVADGAKDTPATRHVMGHADAGMDDVYRERIDDARLKAVADHVRAWLFGP